MAEVWAAREWKTNADMIAEVFSLHVKNPDAVVLDPTFGDGNFYTVHRPLILFGHDKYKGPCFDGVDWGDLFDEDDSVDVFVFDPPYVSVGGRDTSKTKEMHDAYGMASTQHSPEAQWTDILRGFDEAKRVLKPKGLLMVKVMPYVSSGHLKNVLRWTFEAFDDLGFELLDWFVYVGKPGPQPKSDKCRDCIAGTVTTFGLGLGDGKVRGATGPLGDANSVMVDMPCPTCQGLGKKPRPQKHARNNASHLLVARKKAPARKKSAK